MIRKVLCPRCGQPFTFETNEVPVQRAELRGCRLAPVIAHYPICSHCRETVEITDPSVPGNPAKRRLRRSR